MRKQEQRRERVNDFVRDKIIRDKQEERKRKAEMLIQKLKTTSNELTPTVNSTDSTTTSSTVVNPMLVEKLLNVKNDRSSSSAITSPRQYHRSKHSRSPSKSQNRSKYHRRSRSKSSHRRSRRSSHK